MDEAAPSEIIILSTSTQCPRVRSRILHYTRVVCHAGLGNSDSVCFYSCAHMARRS